jgi:TetR/AcrR family transcriptional regulator
VIPTIPQVRTNIAGMSWEERTSERSPAVQRSRLRTVQQARVLVDAAVRLIAMKGDGFTTQELVKEAGVALQTFYRYFASKDELILAVIADSITSAADGWAEVTADLPDPIDRLHFYITSIFETVDDGGDRAATSLFIVSSHWRLLRVLPRELAAAEKPLVDLVLAEIQRGQAAGLLHPPNSVSDAWFVMELARSVLHHYAYAPNRSEGLKTDLWNFCLTALGGTPAKAKA